MDTSQGSAAPANRTRLQSYLAREPVLLAALSLLAVASFLAVTGLSRLFHAQQASLGQRWFDRGAANLGAQRYDRAMQEFRAALRYSRDNYLYQLNLAEALIGAKRTSEASAYLLNLWDRQPENGLVNLDLARIAAQQGEIEQALRYYHNAIYATWPSDEEVQRRETRVELIEFLLRLNAKAQAQSELIALAANAGEDATQQVRIGDLFMRAQDYEHALAAYRVSLRSERHNAASLAGAGSAAFELGQYPTAYHYLQAAVASNPRDTESAERLKTTELVLQMDPFQRQISVAQRNRLVVRAFQTAGERLKSCTSAADSSVSAAQGKLSDSWTKLNPQISERGLQRDPDLVESAMHLVSTIERQTASACGPPAGADQALLLIAKQHEGN